MFDVYDNFCEGGGDDDGVDGCYGDDVGEGPINGDSDDRSDDELDDSNFLRQLSHRTKAELLVGSERG
jgi:hypothetical protein